MLQPFSLVPSILIVLLSRRSLGQISGCDEINCPEDQYRIPQCTLGNTTTSAIGISTFNSSLTPNSLTWTIAVQQVDVRANTFERSFFLGSPSSLDLRAIKPSQAEACALFFDGISSDVRFPGTDPEFDQGTCSDALTSACVFDLIGEARNNMLNKTIQGNQQSANGSIKSSCQSIAESVQTNMPTSCSIALQRPWGNILVRPLTGSEVPLPESPGNCNPTTKENYNLTLTAAHRTEAPSSNVSDLADILYGATPIMTVVRRTNTKDPEVSLSCLKVVGAKQHGSSVKQNNARARKASPKLILALTSLLIFLISPGLT